MMLFMRGYIFADLHWLQDAGRTQIRPFAALHGLAA
jgi:hypothetical protein